MLSGIRTSALLTFLTFLAAGPYLAAQDTGYYANYLKERRQKGDSGDRDTQYQIGEEYYLQQDYSNAFKWLQLSAKNGFSRAQCTLGFMYHRGLGIKKDQSQAVIWYTLAAAQGDATAEFNLGETYGFGQGVRKNSELAIKWFTLSYSHDHSYRSLLGIASVYESDKHYAEARHWFKEAAESDSGEGEYELCRMLGDGIGGPVDYNEALKWCSESAKEENDWGQEGMGVIYEEGRGVPQDYEKAAKWYRMSAEQGNPEAQLRLAILCVNGHGIRRDAIEAYMWLAIAGSENHPWALKYLEMLTPQLKEAEIADGQTRAQEWIEQHPHDPDTLEGLEHIGYGPQ
jgi:TPR repeat protein